MPFANDLRQAFLPSWLPIVAEVTRKWNAHAASSAAWTPKNVTMTTLSLATIHCGSLDMIDSTIPLEISLDYSCRRREPCSHRERDRVSWWAVRQLPAVARSTQF